MSTEHMFGTFDLAVDEDILIPMGAVDGVLPGQTEYKCNQLRSVIELVYNTPGDCHWENLADTIRDFTSREVSKDDLVRYSGQGVFHKVERNQLLQVSQVVVSVDQVLQVLADFCHKREWERFVLDPPVLIPKTTSLPFKPNQDTSYIMHTTTPHFCSVKTSNTTNQLLYTNVWERFRPNVNQLL